MLDPSRHFKGYLPDLPTPFDADGKLDLVAFVRLCRRHVADGGGAFVVCTATGEAPTLTRQERIALIRCAVRTASGRVPVIAGATSNATLRAVELTRDAQDAGASAVLSGVPYYNKPTQEGIEAHFREVAAVCRVPLILLDEPGRCVRALDDAAFARLAELPAIAGLCDASGDLSRLARLRGSISRDISLLSGNDVSAPNFIAMGGDGCISGTCVIAPLLCRAIYNQASTGDMAKARRLALELATLTTALSADSEPAPLKYALAQEGAMLDVLRLPLVSASKPAQQRIAAAMTTLRAWIDCDGERAADCPSYSLTS